MANHHSAKVRIRRAERRTVINGDRLGRVRTHVKMVESAIASGDKSAAETAQKTPTAPSKTLRDLSTSTVKST